MTMLPDVPSDEYRQYLSDQFSKGATDQINALSDPPPTPHSEFMAADEAQAASAPTPAAPTPPPEPAPAPAAPTPSTTFIPADSPASSGPTPIRFSAAPPDTGFRSPGVVPSTTFLPADSAASPILSNASPPDTGFRSPPVTFLPDDSSSPSATPSALPPELLRRCRRAATSRATLEPRLCRLASTRTSLSVRFSRNRVSTRLPKVVPARSASHSSCPALRQVWESIPAIRTPALTRPRAWTPST